MVCTIQQLYDISPPIIQAAVKAILVFEDECVDPIGYDISYYQEDLPQIVKKAIAPWTWIK